MSNYVEMAGKTHDQYLAALAESQDRFLSMLSAWSRWMPRVPAGTTSPVPLSEMTSAWFAFSEKFVEQQKAFLERFTGATTDAASRKSPSKTVAAKPAARTKRKATSSKAAKKKRARVKPASH